MSFVVYKTQILLVHLVLPYVRQGSPVLSFMPERSTWLLILSALINLLWAYGSGVEFLG